MRHHKFITITATPTIDTAIYASGDRMGSIMTLANAVPDTKGKCNVVSVNVVDKAKQNVAFDILIFNQSPTIASADNAAFDMTDAQALNLCGVIPIAAGDYTAAWTSNSQATKMNINLICSSIADSKNLYAVCVTRGAPTYASTTDLQITFGLEQL